MLDGLGEVAVRAVLQTVLAQRLAGAGSDEDDRNAGGVGMPPENFAHGEAVEFGQHQIQNDQIGRDLPRPIKGFESVGGGNDLVAFRRQNVSDEFAKIRLVIHH